MNQPRPPVGCAAAGRKLWKSIVGAYELGEHELVLLAQAVHLADRAEALHVAIGVQLLDETGRINPLITEHRQTTLALSRVLVALRVPQSDDDEKAATSPTHTRPQRRGLRGVYGGAA